MKKIFILISILAFSIQANAEYMVKYNIEPQPNSIIMIDWQSTDATYTSWQSIGDVYGCSNWTPDESTIVIGQNFTQERICNINQERLKQDRELSSKGAYKDIGDPQLETRVETVNQTRNNTGLMESWVSIGSTYGDWTNAGELYDCSNWSPSPSTINNGVSFTQNATDCKQNQTRTRQDREQETTTLAIRNIGSEVVENQVLTNQSSSRNNVGTKINKVCLFDNSNMWSDSYSILNFQMITYNGTVIYFEYGTAINQFELNGYIYTRGSYVNTTVDNSWGSSVTYYNYYLCSEMK